MDVKIFEVVVFEIIVEEARSQILVKYLLGLQPISVYPLLVGFISFAEGAYFVLALRLLHHLALLNL